MREQTVSRLAATGAPPRWNIIRGIVVTVVGPLIYAVTKLQVRTTLRR